MSVLTIRVTTPGKSGAIVRAREPSKTGLWLKRLTRFTLVAGRPTVAPASWKSCAREDNAMGAIASRV